MYFRNIWLCFTSSVSSCSLFLVLLRIYSLCFFAEAFIREIPLPEPLLECYEKAQNHSARTDYVGAEYSWHCESPIHKKMNNPKKKLNALTHSYNRDLFFNIVLPRLKGDLCGKSPCIRKEIRMLTDEERKRYFDAVNTLKQDTSVKPNKYDALTLIHKEVSIHVGHGGPGFCGWHRIYLLIYEAALQSVDPRICLPYWDSSLDAELPDPRKSLMWTPEFLGNNKGYVKNGPLAGWTTPTGKPVTRWIGQDGDLCKIKTVENVLSKHRYEDTLLMKVNPKYSLEHCHGSAHMFVGGTLENLMTAPCDPTFYLHHTFVDCFFEWLRDSLRAHGVDPEIYPPGVHGKYHSANDSLSYGDLVQQDAYANAVASSYVCQRVPSCSVQNQDCGSKYFTCNVTLGRCLPVVSVSNLSIPSNHSRDQPMPIQEPEAPRNSYCIDGVCNITRWVYVPVIIIAKPSSSTYAPSDHDTLLHNDTDASDSNRTDNNTTLKGYDWCSNTSEAVQTYFVASHGVDYDGHYKQSVNVVDISVAFVAIKDPSISGVSQAILRVYDVCGRVCHPACKVPNSSPPRYRDCSGVLEANTQFPLQYSPAIGNPLNQTEAYCPSLNVSDVFLAFYCDNRDSLPGMLTSSPSDQGKPAIDETQAKLPDCHNPLQVPLA